MLNFQCSSIFQKILLFAYADTSTSSVGNRTPKSATQQTMIVALQSGQKIIDNPMSLSKTVTQTPDSRLLTLDSRPFVNSNQPST